MFFSGLGADYVTANSFIRVIRCTTLPPIRLSASFVVLRYRQFVYPRHSLYYVTARFNWFRALKRLLQTWALKRLLQTQGAEAPTTNLGAVVFVLLNSGFIGFIFFYLYANTLMEKVEDTRQIYNLKVSWLVLSLSSLGVA